MELTAESDSNSKPPPSSNHRSILTIDLNETPSSSETLPSPSSSSAAAAAAVANAALPVSPISLVRYFHDNPPPVEGPAADIPGEGRVSDCGACGRPEVKGHVVVCDGCERGFHFVCAGMRGRQAAALEEWVCGECLSGGIGSRRWPLGRKRAARGEAGRPLFDINASPPSDEDGGGGVMVAAGINGGESEEVSMVQDSRKHTLDDKTFGDYPIGVPLSRPNILPSSNGFGFRNASFKHTLRLDLEDILHHRHTIARSFDEVKFGSQQGRRRSSSNTTIRLPSWDPSEIFLQSLREFITERHGVLEEGWHVELKPSKSSCELCAVYCSPDGRIFETMSDVACHLGIVPNGISVESEVRSVDGSAALQKGPHAQKRRKLSGVPVVNGFSENKSSVMTVFGKGLSSLGSAELHMSNFDTNQEVMEAGKDGCTDFQQFNDGLPVQYEDFFILSLGKIDARPSYHNVCQIWPVGYRSCWHDKVTGSLFLCDVVDDGDSGPLFKVRRFSCSSLPIPYGSTILSRQSIGKPEDLKEKQNDETCSNMSFDEDCNIDMILSNTCLPADDGLLSWHASSSDEACDVQFGGNSQVEINPPCRGSKSSSYELFVGDKIGEFSVDGSTSSLVWSILSRRLSDACWKIYKQTGYVKFFCKHVEDGASSLYCDLANEKSESKFSSMDKFCSLLGAINIPAIIKSDHEFELAADVLKNWMNLDRFGLEMEFVQEIIEQLPAVHGCSQYQFLKSRDSCSMSPMVGNGLLAVNAKTELHGKQATVLNGEAGKRCVTGMIENPLKDDHIPPPGTVLGSKLPPHLVGDILQVWETLWRFYVILGLEMDFPFDQLEVELISPWRESTCAEEKSERDFHENQVTFSNVSRDLSGQMSSSSSEIDRHKERSQIFIRMETLSMREAARARLASSTYSRCTGVVLRKVHISLLNVLVSELQSKVAALVDPTLDGESKPRRGRKRDIDSSSLARRSKFSMLPINELTWPELARRYLLAFLCVDGNLDCAEATGRESGKIFRCLQGDGGLLCGSLSGVAGIEADALLLAEAMKRIYGSSNREKDLLIVEDQEPESTTVSSERMLSADGGIPEWAKALEPVRKLPTNVGTRIRRCVHEALEKGPPEWARKILEHSISKEVYKGNASGPTKKAVLSVLADVQCGSLQPKPRIERCKKTILSVSDLVMRKCRIVLRLAASEDDDKVFCNLLGRNLTSSSENDDEGLLGSAAMVSRPLDFRTIDFRLAAGAYGGSPEAFLEDVRELWSNVLTAHADQPDLVNLAEKLSQNFESLYEREVVSLLTKLEKYSDSDNMNAEVKKEIRDIMVSTAELPKAPWDEGVCKVCGIDKDDDSVLLCDTCDAEYHTYCLNPPLARIPEGNWYCPSCARSATKGSSKGTQVLVQRRGRKYHGEGIRRSLEELTRLAAAMEEKEYWEFSIDERTLLLKFLCEDLLYSVQIRQHLEQCAEMSSDLQQKLRSLYSEVKTLKVREDILASRAVKVGQNEPNVTGETSVEEGQVAVANSSLGIGLKPALSSKSMNAGSISIDVPLAEGSRETREKALFSHDLNRHLNTNHSEKKSCSYDQFVKPADASQPVHADAVRDNGAGFGNHTSHQMPLKCLDSSGPRESFTANLLSQEISGMDSKSWPQGELCEGKPKEVQGHPTSEDLKGLSLSSDPGSIQLTECVPSSTLNESHSFNLELNAVRNDISLLQQSIADAEAQLLKFSVRMEFLGSDSCGRLYWVSAKLGARTWVIADTTMALQRKRRKVDHRIVNTAALTGPSASGFSNMGGSSASCPFAYEGECSTPSCSQWVSYQSHAEILELVQWLKDDDPKERELKDSIMQWQKLRFHDFSQPGKQCQDDPLSQKSSSMQRTDSLNCLPTKASTVLEKKYGPWFEVAVYSKKQSKRARASDDKRMYRCKCLEPIWPSRNHCFLCHRTFLTPLELEKHNDGRCGSAATASERRKESGEPSGGLPLPKSDTRPSLCAGDGDTTEASISAGSELNSSLIKFQNEGIMCPFRFEEISSKFVTNDSIKEVMQEIGLIASDGTPSFVPSVSTYLNDPALVLAHPQGGVPNNQSECSKKPTSLQGEYFATKAYTGCVSDNSFGRSATKMLHEDSKADRSLLGSLDKKDKSTSLNGCSLSSATSQCCTVPAVSLRPLVGRAAQIMKQLKICLLDIEAALPDEALRLSKVHFERWAWRAFVKAAETIFEMIQATVVLEDMIKTEYLRNEWWYWSSLSAAAKTSTLSALALRIYSLDNAIAYEKASDQNLSNNAKDGGSEQHSLPNSEPLEKSRLSRRVNRKRKETTDG